ncbi:MAG: DNA repair protein RadC [Bacteroidetes bacterium]|nr:MAG: DNA repair protein RadC [Bacteroidota bacterium]
MNTYGANTLKAWSVEERPREKVIANGVQHLTDAELIAILLGSGTRNITAVELARQVLQGAGYNLHELGRQAIGDLLKIKGVGPAKAIAVMAAMELGRRRSGIQQVEKIPVKSSHTVFNLFHPMLGDLDHEEFWLLMLNRANRVVGRYKVSQGGLAGTVIDTRIIMKKALDNLASSIIVCHNHPSGNKQPSDADIKITEKLKNAAEMLEIKLLDHVIIADKSYFSFADEGLVL